MEQAEQDCLTLWRYMAVTGCRDKNAAIKHLYAQGKISQPNYKDNCPLCERHRFRGSGCFTCPWPGYGSTQCCTIYSPYYNWYRLVHLREGELSHQQVQAWNSRIYRYIKGFLLKKERSSAT